MKLIRPERQYLEAYRAALETGWSPNNTRPEAAKDE
jgi:hypothetical protein